MFLGKMIQNRSKQFHFHRLALAARDQQGLRSEVQHIVSLRLEFVLHHLPDQRSFAKLRRKRA